jgi:transcriptional regulator GlxA family with amidase domain
MRCDVAVIDPCHGGDHLAPIRVGTLAEAWSVGDVVPIVGYLSVSAAGMRAVQSLARLGAMEIVIRGVDDSTATLGTVVQRAVAAATATRVVAAVRGPLRSLPANVASAITDAFHHPERLQSVGELAAAAKTTRRTLDRWLARGGLASARTLLACARVNAAYHLLTSGHVHRPTVASLLGYASSRSLGREMLAVTGFPASTVAGVSGDEFVAALERTLVRVVPHSPHRARLAASY